MSYYLPLWIASTFMGGGSTEIALNTGLGLEVNGYDVLNILCNCWRVQLQTSKALARRLAEIKPDWIFRSMVLRLRKVRSV